MSSEDSKQAAGSKKSAASNGKTSTLQKQSSQPYWTLSRVTIQRNGHSCRECKKVIQIGERVAVRDGRKIRLFYHEGCFSGEADPRTQPNSSFQKSNSQKFNNCISEAMPTEKGYGKWSTKQYGCHEAEREDKQYTHA